MREVGVRRSRIYKKPRELRGRFGGKDDAVS